jgi:hypothetical protein
MLCLWFTCLHAHARFAPHIAHVRRLTVASMVTTANVLAASMFSPWSLPLMAILEKTARCTKQSTITQIHRIRIRCTSNSVELGPFFRVYLRQTTCLLYIPLYYACFSSVKCSGGWRPKQRVATAERLCEPVSRIPGRCPEIRSHILTDNHLNTGLLAKFDT